MASIDRYLPTRCWPYAALVIGIASIIYVRTLSPGVLAGDSAEFQYVPATWDLPHTTGYPSYVILGHTFGLLPIGSMAYRMNLFSAICGALCCGGVVLLALQLDLRRWTAVGVGLVLATSDVFWSQAVIAEVYTLNALFLVCSVILAIHWARSRQIRWLYALAVVTALGVGNHLSMTLALPLLLVYLLVRRPSRSWLHYVAAAALCVGVVAALYWYVLHHCYVRSGGDWSRAWKRFSVWVTGAQFHDHMFPFGWNEVPGRVMMYARLFTEQFWWLGGALMLGSPWRRWNAAWLMLAALLVENVAYSINWDVNDVDVFFLPSFVWAALFLGRGAENLARWLPARSGTFAPGSVLIALAVALAWTNFSTRDRSQDRWDEMWSDRVLAEIAPQGIVIIDWRRSCTLLYRQRIDGLRPDALVIRSGFKTWPQAVERALITGRPVYVERHLELAAPLSLVPEAGVLRVVSRATQYPRPSIRIDGAFRSVAEIGVASSGDLSAILWTQKQPGPPRTWLSWADGRGLSWSAPQLLGTTVVGQDPLGEKSVRVLNGAVCVVSRQASHLVFRRYVPPRGFLPEVVVPKGSSPTVGSVVSWRMAVSAEGGRDEVYILQAVEAARGQDAELWLASSQDGGLSFVATRVASGTSPGETMMLNAEGGAVHAAWLDASIWHARSIDGGRTFLPRQRLSIASDIEGSAAMDVRGDVVAVAWSREDRGVAEVHANVSVDGGNHWYGATLVRRGGSGFWSRVGFIDVGATGGGMVLVGYGWQSQGHRWNVYSQVSADDGRSWSSSSQHSLVKGRTVRIATAGSSAGGRAKNGVAVLWREGGHPEVAKASYSHDGGVTWNPAITLSDRAVRARIREPGLAYNDHYDNFISAWRADRGAKTDIYVGGFRPQMLVPVGWQAGSEEVGFEFRDFDPLWPIAGALLALAPGTISMPPPDSRVLGLAIDDLTLRSLDLAVKGPFSARLDSRGCGVTPGFSVAIPGGLPTGLSLHAIGVGFDPKLGLGEITDVVTIQL